jgi:uncharacterized protein (DUF58 family)
MLTFSDRVEKFIPPRKGLKHVLRVVREALYNHPTGYGTDINSALEHLNRVTKRRTIAFVVSDFFAPDYRKMLSITNKRHDVIGVTIVDPAEIELPKAGLLRLHDAETQEPCLIDTSDPDVRRSYKEKSEKLIAKRKEAFRSTKVDNIDIRTDRSYTEPLIHFFKMRERRFSRI